MLSLCARVILIFTFSRLSYSSINNCIECLIINVGEPEQLGGPTGGDYDSPVTAIIVNTNPNNHQMRQYSANSISYLIYNNSKFLTNPVQIGLGRGPNATDLDHCGAWLNSAINNLQNDSFNIVHGFYHEEWQCDYANNFYTNKSIAYAVSTNAGLNFTKPNYPNNQIITPANSTTQHQTGEGDHQIAVLNNSLLYLYFTEWDGPNGKVTVGLAKSEQNGLPGTWYKYLNSQFNAPGLGGDSSAIAGITGTCVRYRKIYNDFIAMGNRLTNKILGFGPRLSFSNDGIHDWIGMNASLLYCDEYQWNRQTPVGELVAYPSLISRDIVHNNNDNIYNFLNNNSYWLYYTYVEPNATFADRYLARRTVDIIQYGKVIPNTVPQIRVALSYYYNENISDSWFTTAMIPKSEGYKNMNDIYGMLMSVDIGSELTTVIYDCFIPEWNDHMIGMENECDIVLRTLGWLYNKEINNEYVQTVALYRCFNDTVKNHFISLDDNCDNNGKDEFRIGYIIRA